MHASVTKRITTTRKMEWVISADPEINYNEVLTVIGWAQQEVADGGSLDNIYDNEIKIRGGDDGSVIVSIVKETSETVE